MKKIKLLLNVVLIATAMLFNNTIYAGCNNGPGTAEVELDYIVEDWDGNEVTSYVFPVGETYKVFLTVDGEKKTSTEKTITTSSTGEDLKTGFTLKYDEGVGDGCEIVLDDEDFKYTVYKYVLSTTEDIVIKQSDADEKTMIVSIAIEPSGATGVPQATWRIKDEKKEFKVSRQSATTGKVSFDDIEYWYNNKLFFTIEVFTTINDKEVCMLEISGSGLKFLRDGIFATGFNPVEVSGGTSLTATGPDWLVDVNEVNTTGTFTQSPSGTKNYKYNCSTDIGDSTYEFNGGTAEAHLGMYYAGGHNIIPHISHGSGSFQAGAMASINITGLISVSSPFAKTAIEGGSSSSTSVSLSYPYGVGVTLTDLQAIEEDYAPGPATFNVNTASSTSHNSGDNISLNLNASANVGMYGDQNVRMYGFLKDVDIFESMVVGVKAPDVYNSTIEFTPNSH